MINKNAVVINLDELQKTAPLPEEQIIYKEEYSDLKKKIIEKIEIEDERRNDAEYTLESSRKLCFFIDGVRGSGKSTILRTLEKDLIDLKKPKIELLASIDPTEFGETENFFIHILGHIQKKLQTIKNRCFLNDTDKNYLRISYDCIQTMSRGLSLLIRNPDTAPHYDDANYLIQKSIMECVSSSGLKKKFAELTEVLCKLFNVDVLMVTLDDADMNFSKCKDVMETVRKHLLTPRMLFIFAGDIHMFGAIVRGMQLDNIGHLSLQFDSSMRTRQRQLIDNIEDQYIMKFFPVENRMNLRGFRNKLQNEIILKYRKLKSSKPISLHQFIEKCDKESSVHLDSGMILDYLPIFPMRSILQLLSYWANYISKENTPEHNARVMCRGIRHIASMALKKNKIADEIEYEFNLLLKYVLRHAKNMKLGTNGAKLLPGSGDETMQMVSFYLSAEVSRQVRNIADVLSYVLNVFPLLHTYGSNVEADDKFYNSLNDRILNFNGAACTKEMLEVYRENDRQAKPFANGVIPLLAYPNQNNDDSLQRSSSKNYFDKLIAEVKKDTNEDKLKHFIFIYHSVCICEINGNLTFCLSIYNLIFVIQRLLSLDLEKVNKDDIKSILCDNKNITFHQKSESYFNKKKLSVNNDAQNASEQLRSCMDELSGNEAFENLISSIIKNKINLKRIIANPGLLHDFWKDFLQNCSIITATSLTHAQDSNKIVRTGTLYIRYMNAFSQSLKKFFRGEDGTSDDNLESSFLWNVGNENNKRYKKLFDLLNQTNIAPIYRDIDFKKFEIEFENDIKTVIENVSERIKSKFSEISRNYLNRYKALWESIHVRIDLQIIYNRDESKILSEELISLQAQYMDILLKNLYSVYDTQLILFQTKQNYVIETHRDKFKNSLYKISTESTAQKLLISAKREIEILLNKIWNNELSQDFTSKIISVENNMKSQLYSDVIMTLKKLGINIDKLNLGFDKNLDN